MKFSLKKYNAFTVGELMVMLSVLTVLLAAFAPVFTVRYNNASSDYVWQYVADSEEFDSYSDPPVDALTAQSFIGITPASKAMVAKAVESDNNDVLYSKVIIRPSHHHFNGEVQKTIQFRYGNDNKGNPVAALYANNGNILLGGLYKKLESNAINNTAFGRMAMNDLTTGKNNTALGYSAGAGWNTNHDNTVIESNLQVAKSVKGSQNTFVNIISDTTATGYSITGNDNVAVSSILPLGSQNTYISPFDILHKPDSSGSDGNTVLGGEFIKNVKYKGNTIIGYKAGFDEVNSEPKYNTIIGSYAGSGMNFTPTGLSDKASNKTCIGYGSCSKQLLSNTTAGILNDETERVFIGGFNVVSPDINQQGIAPLEVHNLNSTALSSTPVPNMGSSSVLINGNLIVRGQPYFTTGNATGRALMGFILIKPQPNGAFDSSVHVFMADDFHDKDIGGGAIKEPCGGRCKGHASSTLASNGCVCVHPCTRATGERCESFDNNGVGYTSYDWVTKAENYNSSGQENFWSCMTASDPTANGKSYEDHSLSTSFSRGRYEINHAHTLRGSDADGSSCCPNLLSDIRLKNLSGRFVDNLDAIRSINAYNYTFKSDPEKRPQVGVIAQDLKLIFPDAVTKDKNGYYQIRWDEMLYAAVNAVKALNEKVVKLTQRVIKDKERISALKKDNAGLVKRLDVLSAELSVLESQKK